LIAESVAAVATKTFMILWGYSNADYSTTKQPAAGNKKAVPRRFISRTRPD
jgi:hypothetical protein